MRTKVPIQDKFLQTIDEAAEYFGIGTDKIKAITNDGEGMKCVLYNGRKRLIKRKEMEKFLSSQYEI